MIANEEPDVLPRIAAGDMSAVSDCITRYGAMVYGLARRFLRNTATADDAVQDIFIELWKVAPKFDRGTAKESTFILTIARRRLIDRLRREKVRGKPDSIESVAEPVADETNDQVETRDLAARANEALQQLPDDQRTVLQTAIGDGLTYSEIAERYKMPLGTVKSHARRGLIRLRELLGVSEPMEQR